MIIFEANDTILYGTEGICQVAGTTEKMFNGEKLSYYVLRPVHNETATIFVPMKNRMLTDKMRKILTAEEIYALIRSMPEEASIWIENDSERKDAYAKILSGGNRTELVRLIKTLYLRHLELHAKGKKLHLADERFFKEAEKMLYDEFALVLHIPRDQVLPYIMEQLDVEVNHAE